MPDAVDLIRAKRDGDRLSPADIGWLIDAYTAGAVAEEQMSALLMAIYFRGLDPEELRAWTRAMISSGERLDLSGLNAPTVDKHSTGVSDTGACGRQLRRRGAAAIRARARLHRRHARQTGVDSGLARVPLQCRHCPRPG